jgi:hypothetical protein
MTGGRVLTFDTKRYRSVCRSSAKAHKKPVERGVVFDKTERFSIKPNIFFFHDFYTILHSTNFVGCIVLNF